VAGPQEKLFRKVSLERLSSPEELDAMVRVITPRAWLALAPLLGLIALAALWGWFGELPTKVHGRCILINPTGLADVSSGAAGRITELMVKVGDRIAKDAAVARVAQPELLDRIEKAEGRVRELEDLGKVVRSFADQGSALTRQAHVEERALLESQAAAAGERARNARETARIARERLAVQEELLKQGLVTSQSVLAVRQEEVAARQEETAALLDAETRRNRIRQLPLAGLERDKQGRNEVANAESRLAEARRQLDSAREAGRHAALVESPYAGRVTEIKAGRGMLVGQGAPVVTVELEGGAGEGVEAVLYVPVADGRKVRPAMAAQVVPSTVRREEHGFIRAEVRTVSDYPATPQNMLMLLQNDTLVRELAGSSPPLEIRATLRRAAGRSGYLWSSARGPDMRLASGTMCSAEIMVDSQRPLALVLPVLRRSLGLD
jgi:HlyD family secretion protein